MHIYIIYIYIFACIVLSTLTKKLHSKFRKIESSMEFLNLNLQQMLGKSEKKIVPPEKDRWRSPLPSVLVYHGPSTNRHRTWEWVAIDPFTLGVSQMVVHHPMGSQSVEKLPKKHRSKSKWLVTWSSPA